jgi:uncharacterized membrane protein
MKLFFLYFMAFAYGTIGVLHLVFPKKFRFVMPSWMPVQMFLIIISGIAEILLALMLLFDDTRILSAWLIIAMLILYFFLNHVPQAIDFHKRKHKYLIIVLIRLPLQFLLIWYAWIYTKPL